MRVAIYLASFPIPGFLFWETNFEYLEAWKLLRAHPKWTLLMLKKMDGKLAGDDRPQGQNSAKDQNRMLSLPRL